MRRTERTIARTRPALQPAGSALRLPPLRSRHWRRREHPAAELSVPARQVQRLRCCHLAPLPHRRGNYRGAERLRRGAFRLRHGGNCSHRVWLGDDRPHFHRLRHPVATGRHHPAFALAGFAAQSQWRLHLVAKCGNRCGCRLSCAVERVLGIQACHRQGGHGLRRLQAAGGDWRVAGVADAAAGHPAFVAGWRGGRHCPHCIYQTRPQHPHSVRALSRRRRADRTVLGADADAKLSAASGSVSYLVGLTGGIGSGKSTVADIFASLGVRIIDTDLISHQLTQANGAAIPAIREAFGEQLIDPQGALDRTRMRELVFQDALQKKRLEAILHPLILAQTRKLAASATNAPYSLIVVPLLFESSRYSDWLHRVITVDCPEETQISRTLLRSRLDEASVRAIMAQQISRSERLRLADEVIENNGSLDDLKTQIVGIHRRLSVLAAESD
ncbi:MAG: dephospho-CoA kinase [Nitrosomonadales bacterium]|nr:dephospho-CoA kinase [Nitrosomonadales bacterium]